MNFEKSPLIELHYLPNLLYCSLLSQSQFVFIEAHETFNKRSFRNKTLILGSNRVLTLTVPIKHNTKKHLISHLQIDYSQAWHVEHWHSIEYAYRKAPYFEEVAPYFKDILYAKKKLLFELNLTLLNLIFDLLDMSFSFELTEYFEKKPIYASDWRERIHPKKNFKYKLRPYLQLFGNQFIPNLSILDLLFSQGKQSAEYLKQIDL